MRARPVSHSRRCAPFPSVMPPLLFAPRTTAAAPKLLRLRLHLLPRDRLRFATRHATSPDAKPLDSAACPTAAARPINALGVRALDKP
jgi:hypothetical protein